MNTISSTNARRILAHLDDIKKLTDLLRRAHFDVPYREVYDAAGGEATIREILYGAAVHGVSIETPALRTARDRLAMMLRPDDPRNDDAFRLVDDTIRRVEGE